MSPQRPLADDAAFVLRGAVRAVALFVVLVAGIELVAWGTDGLRGWGADSSQVSVSALVLTFGAVPALVLAVPLGLVVERRARGTRGRVTAYALLGAAVPVVVGSVLTSVLRVGVLAHEPGYVVALASAGAVATPLAWWWSQRARQRSARRRRTRGPSDEQLEDALATSLRSPA